MDHGLFAVSTHDHLLFLQLFGYVFGARSADIDPGFGEECAGAEHEHDVDEAVDGVFQDVRERLWRREIVANPT